MKERERERHRTGSETHQSFGVTQGPQTDVLWLRQERKSFCPTVPTQFVTKYTPLSGNQHKERQFGPTI